MYTKCVLSIAYPKVQLSLITSISHFYEVCHPKKAIIFKISVSLVPDLGVARGVCGERG